MRDHAVARRNSLRKPGHDYRTAGIYFLTLETHALQRLFGKVNRETMHLSGAGVLVRSRWLDIPDRFNGVCLDDFVIMPDHLHGIIVLTGMAPGGTAPTIGEIIRWFKASVIRRYRAGVEELNWPPYEGRLWRDDYYDRILSTDDALHRARAYMRANPQRWWEKRGDAG